MWKIFKKKEKSIDLYMVIKPCDIEKEKWDENPNMHIYTITETEEQALEWIDKFLFGNYITHFGMWCDLHDRDASKETWEYYKENIIGIDKINEMCIISKVSYSLSNIAILFRIYNSCVPLGCSFDDPLEVKNYTAMVEKLKELEKLKVEK